VPIVFLTAKTSALDVVEGINAGARSYVTKPFKMNALVERLDKILNGPARRS
jgi:DNA-binding response OmpR family regulator